MYLYLFTDNTLYIELAEEPSQPARYKIILLGYIETS